VPNRENFKEINSLFIENNNPVSNLALIQRPITLEVFQWKEKLYIYISSGRSKVKKCEICKLEIEETNIS